MPQGFDECCEVRADSKICLRWGYWMFEVYAVCIAWLGWCLGQGKGCMRSQGFVIPNIPLLGGRWGSVGVLPDIVHVRPRGHIVYLTSL